MVGQTALQYGEEGIVLSGPGHYRAGCMTSMRAIYMMDFYVRDVRNTASSNIAVQRRMIEVSARVVVR